MFVYESSYGAINILSIGVKSILVRYTGIGCSSCFYTKNAPITPDITIDALCKIKCKCATFGNDYNYLLGIIDVM